jgi:antitoxin component of RelBE/YafQ-DinJ toxin-antitoxin module
VAVTGGHDWTGAMTDIVLKDIDEFLLERIKRVADRRGWPMTQALRHLLEQGLYAVEGDGKLGFDNSEADVLQAAIAALEEVPDGVFSMIGQLPSPDSR